MSHRTFYRQARYYDIAFSYRDVAMEVDFLEACHRQHGRRPLQRVLELASGPGYHAIELARRGKGAVALDLSPEMIEICQVKSKAAGVTVRGLVADMCRFRVEERVDLAFNPLTSISYVLDDEALLAHFAAVYDALADGGVYIVENNHPRDFFAGEHFQPSCWTMSRDGTTIETTWCAVPPKLHYVAQTYDVTARYRVSEGGETFEFVDEAPLRMLLPGEMKLMAERCGFTWAAFYGDFDLQQPLDDSEKAWRTLAVFRKPGA